MQGCKDCTHNRENRHRWGPGPWQQEPDHAYASHAGLPYQLHRSVFSWWTGLVGLPRSHRLCGEDGSVIASMVDVKGRIELAYWAGGHSCTPPDNCSSGTWWVHMELNLYGQAPADYGPLLRAGTLNGTWRYWTLEEARAEVQRLAEQLAALR